MNGTSGFNPIIKNNENQRNPLVANYATGGDSHDTNKPASSQRPDSPKAPKLKVDEYDDITASKSSPFNATPYNPAINGATIPEDRPNIVRRSIHAPK